LDIAENFIDRKVNSWNMMYGYVEYPKYAINKGVTTFKHSKPQVLLLPTDIHVFLLSTVLRGNAIHNAGTPKCKRQFGKKTCKISTVEPGYNDIGLCDSPHITSDILLYRLIPHVNHDIILLGYNDTRV